MNIMAIMEIMELMCLGQSVLPGAPVVHYYGDTKHCQDTGTIVLHTRLLSPGSAAAGGNQATNQRPGMTLVAALAGCLTMPASHWSICRHTQQAVTLSIVM